MGKGNNKDSKMDQTKIETEASNKKSNSSLSFHEFADDKKTSSLKKYQDLIIGSRKWGELIKFELITFFLMNLPAIPGLFLRQKFYKYLFQNCAHNSTFGVGFSVRQPSKISIGKSCIIDDMVRLSVRGDMRAGIELIEKVFIGRNSEINVRNGRITIDSNSSIGSNCKISTQDGLVKIGKYVFIAAYCYIGGGNHKIDRIDVPIAEQGFESKGGVNIGDDVWIGANSIISDGVSIGKGSVIGACSFVNRDIPDYSIAFGSPAKVYKKRI